MIEELERDLPLITIDQQGAGKQYWKDLLSKSELISFFAWRDVKVRYAQAFLGIIWALFRPFLNMAAVVMVFGWVGKMSSGDTPYPLFVLAGMIPWQFFASCLQTGSTLVLSNAGLISKVYFPRVILPISSIAVNLIDFLVASLVFFPIAFWMGYLDPMRLLAFVPFTLLMLILCAGIVLWVSAVTVRFRDLMFVIPFFMQMLMFLCPVVYPTGALPQTLQWILLFNPMTGIVQGFHWALLGFQEPSFSLAVTISCIESSLILLTGVFFYRNQELAFADVV